MKEYAIRIENNEHGLIFHMFFTEKEFRESKIWIGAIEMIAPFEGKMAPHVDARVKTLYELFEDSRIGEENAGGFKLIS